MRVCCNRAAGLCRASRTQAGRCMPPLHGRVCDPCRAVYATPARQCMRPLYATFSTAKRKRIPAGQPHTLAEIASIPQAFSIRADWPTSSMGQSNARYGSPSRSIRFPRQVRDAAPCMRPLQGGVCSKCRTSSPVRRLKRQKKCKTMSKTHWNSFASGVIMFKNNIS